MTIDWIFPLLAITIYICTPKGCDKTINWVLAGMFVLIWGFEEAIHGQSKIQWLAPYFYDGIWYDSVILAIFGWAGFLFHRAGGKVQLKLAMVGMALCAVYGYFGTTELYSNGDITKDMYYREVMITLYIFQLFIAGGGMMFALSNKWMDGDKHGSMAGNNRNIARNSNVNHGDS